MPDEINWNKIKIPLGVLAGLVMFIAPAVNWFSDYHATFITAAEAGQEIDQHLEELSRKVDQNTNAVTDLQQELRIRMSLARVEALEARLYILNRDGADPDLIHEVEADLNHARSYSNCLVDGKPNCQHLELGRSR